MRKWGVQHGHPPPAFPRHFDGRRFFNPNAPQALGLFDVLRWKLTTRPQPSPKFIADVKPCKPLSRVEGSSLKVTLVNHSTVLIQHNGTNILTDPIWSQRCSPLSWAGPQRRRDPGIRWEDLPRIDIVLLSHNHYDHLDLVTLRSLARRGESQFVVPAGVARLLQTNRIGPVYELDWGEFVERFGINFHAVPALHFSARGMADRNRTLWCGFMIEAPHRLIYYAGDSAFGTHFAAIRDRFGPPNLALLPIGAYEPRWFMSPVHMGPDDALKVHHILGAQTSIAIHHGTFQLADEALDTPRQQLAAGLRGERFLILNNGEAADIP